MHAVSPWFMTAWWITVALWAFAVGLMCGRAIFSKRPRAAVVVECWGQRTPRPQVSVSITGWGLPVRGSQSVYTYDATEQGIARARYEGGGLAELLGVALVDRTK